MSDFDEIYRLYFDDVYKYVLTLSRNHSIAEEITQETFLRPLKISVHLKGTVKYTYGCVRLQRTHILHITKGKKNPLVWNQARH